MGVLRLGYVHMRVTDLEEAKRHYGYTMGLMPAREEPPDSTTRRRTSGASLTWLSDFISNALGSSSTPTMCAGA